MSKQSTLSPGPDSLYPTLTGPGWGAGVCICGPPGSCCMKASNFLLFFNSLLFNFTESFFTSLCLHWKEKQKLSHDHDAPSPSSSYQGSLSQPPLQGVVASILGCVLYESMPLIIASNTIFSLFSLHLIPFPHLYLFSQLMKCTEQSFSSPTTLSWLKQFIENTFHDLHWPDLLISSYSPFHSCGFSHFFIVVSPLCTYGDMADRFIHSLTILVVFLYCSAVWAILRSPGVARGRPTQPHCCWHLTLSSPGNFQLSRSISIRFIPVAWKAISWRDIPGAPPFRRPNVLCWTNLLTPDSLYCMDTSY